jgi:hypothetical protein
LQDVEVDVSGFPICPRITFDFEKNIFIRGYDTLFSSKKLTEHGNFITRNDYPNGNTIICFDLTPDKSDADYVDLRRTGKLNLNLNIKKNLEDRVYLMCFYEYDSIIEITNNNVGTKII